MWDGIGKQGAGRFVGTAVLDGKLYAVGRASEADEAPSISVDRYDLASKAWEAVAPMATARDELTVAVLDGKLYAVGGTNPNDGSLSSAERYDPPTNVWEAVAPMAEARAYHDI